MSNEVSKLTRKELQEKLKDVEHLLRSKTIIERLPDKGKKLMDSRLKMCKELKFRKDMEQTTMTMQHLLLSQEDSIDLETARCYAMKKAKLLDRLPQTKPPNRNKVNSPIKTLNFTESLRVAIEKHQKTQINPETGEKSNQPKAANRFVNFREVEHDSDDDDEDDDNGKEMEGYDSPT